MLRISIFIGLLLTIPACKNTAERKEPAAQSPKPQQVKSYAWHSFSDPHHKDSFSIVLSTPDSLINGQVVFTITRYDGKEIFREEFSARRLLTYSISQPASGDDVEVFLRNRIVTFFITENFITPAISSEEEFHADYADETIWRAVKNDPDAIGFYYLLGEEDGRRIAYASSLGRVVQYFNCC